MRSKPVSSIKASVSRIPWREAFNVLRIAQVMAGVIYLPVCACRSFWISKCGQEPDQKDLVCIITKEFEPLWGCRAQDMKLGNQDFSCSSIYLPFSDPHPAPWPPTNNLCLSNTKMLAQRPYWWTSCLHTIVVRGVGTLKHHGVSLSCFISLPMSSPLPGTSPAPLSTNTPAGLDSNATIFRKSSWAP